jgi:predicted phage baseplate assembly protein
VDSMLPAPNLDDRHFQDMVDDAKRLVQQRCPTWTDHNVSDPGVTLIEAFAQMVDQLIYRLNRVPDVNYIKFLELIGVELRPPSAARGEVTFWLAAPQALAVVVRPETQVATPRTDIHDPVIFATSRQLDIVPCAFGWAATQAVGRPPVDHTRSLGRQGFGCFQPVPVVGDALLIGLTAAAPACAVTLRLDCRLSGRGVDPRRPPVMWEALTEVRGWQPCVIGRDDTGGLNRPGDLVLHLPDDHHASVVVGERGGWLRCRLVSPDEGQPTYTASPTIESVTAFTIGGTVPIVHAEVVPDEVIGRSDGTAAQRFALQRRPVITADAPIRLLATVDGEEQVWEQVGGFADSTSTDRHFRLDQYAGEVHLAPAVRGVTGELTRYGAVPSAGTELRIESYRTGGGQVGNVAAGLVRVLKTSVPYVARVENRTPATGGAEAESLSDAKTRGPLLLRSRGRAVTADDFEQLALDVAPDAARVKCLPDRSDSAGVRLLVVPHVASDGVGRIELTDLAPPDSMLQRISESLDQQRLVGTRLLVQPPQYVGLTAVVRLSARAHFDPGQVHTEVLRAIYGLYHPLHGGPDGTGWPFGRSALEHEVHAALARIAGVDMSREVRVQLFPADPGTGRRGAELTRLDVAESALIFSYEHQLRVSR